MTLTKSGNQCLPIYRDKTGMTDEELIQMLDAETWLTADEALGKRLRR